MNTDVLDRLRSVRPDPAVLFSSEVHDAVLDGAVDPRARGEAGMPVAPVALGRRPGRRRVAVIGGAVLAAAAVVTIALVTAELRAPAPSTSEAATQHAVAQQLAAAARRSGALALKPGQYWYVVTTAHRQGNQSSKDETWTAANGSGWARETPTDTRAQHSTVNRLPAENGGTGIPSPDYLASLSTDPAKLLHYLRSQAVVNPLNPTRDDSVYQAISGLLATGYAPSALQAALILDLAELPDVTLSRGTTDALGRASVALDLRINTADGTVYRSLLFDATSGRFLRVSQTAPSVTVTITVVSSSIVDQVPADVTR